MQKKWFIISLLMVLAVILFAACAQSTVAPQEEAPAADEEESIEEQIPEEEVEETTEEESPVGVDVEALIIDKCSGCHSADEVFEKDYDADRWSSVIDRMIAKGAEVSDEEKALMIDWLTGR